jgi:hypothetical protein
MIEKPSILITSLGRTGTEFFARLFAQILPDSTSIHEPDIFQNTGVENKWRHYLRQVRRAGIWRMVILKALGKWTLVDLSDAKFLGRLNAEGAIRGLNAQRKAFVHRMPGAVYVEANIGYYGLLDITPDVFREHRVVYLIRDGRDWVRSHMNWGEFYGKKGIRKLISHNWPAASSLPGDVYADKWHRLSRFEQLCWAWTRLNEYALDTLSKNPHVRVFHFEEIFAGETRYDVLMETITFATSLPGVGSADVGNVKGRLEHRIHQSSEGFPAWENWTNEQKRQFEHICGPFMEKLGYPIL